MKKISRRDFVLRTASLCAVSIVTPCARVWGGGDEPHAGTVCVNKTLSIYNTHTHESAKNVLFFDGDWVCEGLRTLDHIFRDHRTGQAHPIDPNLIMLLYDMGQILGVGPDQPFHLISGFRSPKTNAMLCAKGRGVATKSQHTLGKAADIALPGVRTIAEIKKAALSLKRGGVGAYSCFVHVDTGRVRQW